MSISESALDRLNAPTARDINYCACGCNTAIPRLTKKRGNRPQQAQRFAIGHGRKRLATSAPKSQVGRVYNRKVISIHFSLAQYRAIDKEAQAYGLTPGTLIKSKLFKEKANV